MVSDWKWSWPGSMTRKSTSLKYLVANPRICSLGELPRLLFLLVAPCGPAVVGGAQALEHVLVPGICSVRVGRHHRLQQPRFPVILLSGLRRTAP
jgi:hypothetical protein